MAEINYDHILELADPARSAVSFMSEDDDGQRFRFTCVIHKDNAADPVWQWDQQGKARDGAYPDIVNAQDYTISQVWTVGTMEPGLTTREPVDRALESFEYMIVTKVDIAAGTVTSETIQG
jgi:hypothetical protein